MNVKLKTTTSEISPSFYLGSPHLASIFQTQCVSEIEQTGGELIVVDFYLFYMIESDRNREQ